jgi:hypothetical protein
MNKYIIEGNLDFKTAMSIDLNEEEETCLISQQVLTKSQITLQCGHKFNYMPLYNEVYKQKQKNHYETCNLKINQLKCPYCRKVCDNILPYIQSECIEKTHGVNYPFKYCMKNEIQCEWIQKNKTKCCKEAQFINDASYCKLHYMKSQAIKVKTDTINSETIKVPITWSTEMDNLYKSKKVHELKNVLKLHKFKVGGTKRELIERLFENKLNSVFN